MDFSNSIILLPAWLLASALLVSIASLIGRHGTSTISSSAPQRVPQSGGGRMEAVVR